MSLYHTAAPSDVPSAASKKRPQHAYHAPLAHAAPQRPPDAAAVDVSASPSASARRRSSVTHVAADGVAGYRDGIANLNRWSQSTSSSRSSVRDKTSSAHAAPRPPSPSRTQSPRPRNNSAASRRSSLSSPHRRPRPRSPEYKATAPATALPQIPSLPLLPATVYHRTSPSGSASVSNTPATGVHTPTAAAAATDYFTSKPRPAPSASQRPPSRGKIGPSPLGSPPIGVLESEARHKAKGSVGSASAARDKAARHRSASNASIGLDANPATPPRNSRTDKDKKTMLSRALQKANTAVLLDNAQNFEGAIEAYGDACKLLQHVLVRSPGEEDKRKLEAIVRRSLIWPPAC